MDELIMGRRGFLKLGALLAQAANAGAAGASGEQGPLLESADADVRIWARSGEDGAADTIESQVTRGAEQYRDFVLDNALHSEAHGDIHFNLYVPADYNGSEPAALFVTLPGRQGLYYQGVGINLETEDFAFEAQAYDEDMIVVAPQLMDNGSTSAVQTIALVEWLMQAYNIDQQRVFLQGYSDGGETLSVVMGIRPELFSRALLCSASWEGNMDGLVGAKVPVYMVIGEKDEYYGSKVVKDAAAQLTALYQAQGLSDGQIAELVTLDVKPTSYFREAGVTDQHGGGSGLFCRDEQVMGWLFA